MIGSDQSQFPGQLTYKPVDLIGREPPEQERFQGLAVPKSVSQLTPRVVWPVGLNQPVGDEP